jgi:hypothetical protein
MAGDSATHSEPLVSLLGPQLAEHCLPASRQNASQDAKLLQPTEQFVKGGPHLPAVQNALAAQAFPHAPQLLTSCSRSAQQPPAGASAAGTSRTSLDVVSGQQPQQPQVSGTVVVKSTVTV